MNSSDALFFRILQPFPDEKGEALRQAVVSFKHGQPNAVTVQVDPIEFSAISGTRFAYWFSKKLLKKFTEFEAFESTTRIVRVGLQASDDFRFLRCWWEIDANRIAHNRLQTQQGYRWVNFAKGGAFSPYYCDLHLVVDWNNDGEVTRESGSAFIRNEYLYFHPGFTYPRLPHKKLSVRILPKGCIFSVNGPSIFWINDEIDVRLLAVLNSKLFATLLLAGMGRGTTETSGQTMTVQVGFFQQLPICNLEGIDIENVWESYELVRLPNFSDEITHIFKLPTLLQNGEFVVCFAKIMQAAKAESQRQASLSAIQAKIDSRVADLYDVPELGNAKLEMSNNGMEEDSYSDSDNNRVVKDQLDLADQDPVILVSNLLMWYLGVAFGRWDVRFALDQSLLPELQEPFDPLPVCAPGVLVDPDGLPAKSNGIVSETWLRARPNVISLPKNFQYQ